MAVETIYTLAESNITISDGGELSGITQGDGSHLVGLTITLDNSDWETVQITDDDSNFEDNGSTQLLDGDQTYDGVSYESGLRVESEYSLTLEDPDGNTYVVLGFNINEAGSSSFSTVEGLAFVGGVDGFPPTGVALTVISASEAPSNPYVDLATPACFTQGTMIETLRGPRPIDTLKKGDFVKTLSDGYQPIRWIGSTRLPSAALRNNPKLVPVRIVAGALGNGLPVRDLVVSRQHRLVVSSQVAERMFDSTNVLVPAYKMTAFPGIYADDSTTEVVYFHMLFDTHQIVLAEGAPTESFYTGPEALKSISDAAREEILTLFPQLAHTDDTSPSALPIVAGKKLNSLVARHLKNSKPLLETFHAAE